MAAKIFRINYKSDFILTMNSDAGWAIPFCIKFWTSVPSRAYFVGFDGTTYTHCAYDPSEPTKLVVQFDDHHLPIGDLNYQIAYHFTVADFPNDTEDEVINPANITTEIDGETYQVMLDFTGETAPEIQFSLPAYANEAQRIVNEQQRIAAEETRIDNEAQRIQNEETRINQEQARQDNEAQRIRNEQTRISQEEARVREFATLKRDAQEATTAANDAAALANQKAQLAADKAQLAADKAALAQDAANLANQKAQLAADKAALAQDAADLANQKAQLAQQKAEYAQSQGDYAKRKGDDAAAQMQQQAQAFSEAQAARQTSYEQAEGTESGSVAGDGSRWGAFKTNEAARDAKVDAKVADITNLQEAVAEGAVYDVSAKNPTAGPNNDGKWESLSALLSDANLNTLIPSAFRRGGMSIKFVLSSDNKYVQYRYMGTATTGTPNPFLDIANWQGVTNEIKADSKDLVESGSVADKIVYITGFGTTFNDAGITEIGQIMYNIDPNSDHYKKLRRAVALNENHFVGETVPYYKDVTYIYDNNVYIWDGSALTCIDMPLFRIDANPTSASVINVLINDGSLLGGSIYTEFNLKNNKPFLIYCLGINTADDVKLKIGSLEAPIYYNGSPVSADNSWEIGYIQCIYNSESNLFTSYPWKVVKNELGDSVAHAISQKLYTDNRVYTTTSIVRDGVLTLGNAEPPYNPINNIVDTNLLLIAYFNVDYIPGYETLTVGSTTAPLWYKGKVVSSDNHWNKYDTYSVKFVYLGTPNTYVFTLLDLNYYLEEKFDYSGIINIKGIGTDSMNAGITQIGEVYYNTDTKILRRAYRKYTESGNTYFNFENVPFNQGALYCYNNKLYRLNNNNELIEVYNTQTRFVNDITYYQGGLFGTNGTIVPSGTLHDNAISTEFIPVDINGITISVDKEYTFKIYEYDSNMTFVQRNTQYFNYKYYIPPQGVAFIKIAIFGNVYGAFEGNIYVNSNDVKYIDLSTAEDANLKIQKGKVDNPNPNTVGKWLKNFITHNRTFAEDFVTVMSLQEKQTAFDNAVNALTSDGFTVNKVNIGKDQSGTYDMYGYTISPKNYTFTYAFTAHVHADEVMQPISFIMLMKMLHGKQENPQMQWIKENVRWVGIFMCNPWGYNNWYNTGHQAFQYKGRYNSRNVNLNRNFDINWDNTETEANRKGSTPNSERETQNIIAFFEQYRNNIDVHFDLHDFNAQINAPICSIAGNVIYCNQSEISETRRWLEDFYAVEPTPIAPYGNTGGSVTNYFCEILGIPSITMEHSVYYWSNKGYSIIEDYTIALNETINFAIASINYVNDFKNHIGPFYKKIATQSYRTKEFALNTWADSEIIDKCDETGWTKIQGTFGDVYKSSALESANISILICCGIDTNNNGQLTAYRAMSEIDNNVDVFPYINRLKSNADIYVLPLSSDTTDINQIVQTYSIDKVIYIDGNCITSESPEIQVKQAQLTDFIKYQGYHYSVVSDNAILNAVDNCYIVKLNNIIQQSQRFGCVVANWFEYVLNLAASFAM